MEYDVRDGVVKVGEWVWWHCEEGPEHIRVEEGHRNIMDYPQYYSIRKPVFIQHPEVDWLVIYEYEVGFMHAKKERKVTKTKHERKKPEFTFEDGVDIAFECMEADVCLLPFILKGKGANEVALQLLRTYLKRTRHHDCYTYKPLRKKLKLYIKWLQSHSSAV